MTFKIKYLNEIHKLFHKSALYAAIEKGFIEIIKLLLTNKNIDTNAFNILVLIY